MIELFQRQHNEFCRKSQLLFVKIFMLQAIELDEITQYKMARTFWGRDLYIVAAYFVDGLLIDTGFTYVAAPFYQMLQHRNVEQIVNTHHHEDHVGANYLFEKRRGLNAFAHPEAIALIENPPPKLKRYRNTVWGVPQPASAVAIGDSVATAKYSFHVLHLPGHSPDHIGLYEPQQGWLFAGDLYLSVKVRVLRVDEDIHAEMDSLRQIADLPLRYLFCGSGKILDDPNTLVRKKLAFYEEIQQQVQTLHQKGWEPEKIRDAVLGKEGFWPLLSQGEFSKLNLVKAFLKPRFQRGPI
ncbi:MAG: MBL fold metallo-hydrolase [candidate division KSB1 bacterium]|nr:MBL fold metallo-hydrolase [candidate division KSB1 bacterium]